MFNENEFEVYSKEMVVNKNQGLEYAQIVGDWNLHHLWKWTANIIGYKKPFVQGMWSLQVCISQMMKMFDDTQNTQNDKETIVKWNNILKSDIIKLNCLYRMPWYMPSKALLRTKVRRTSRDKNENIGEGFRFALSSMDLTKPFIIGDITPVS